MRLSERTLGRLWCDHEIRTTLVACEELTPARLRVDLTSMRFVAAWGILGAVAVASVGADLLYLRWREYSLEPLAASVDLTSPHEYHFKVSGFHRSLYFPAFRLDLPMEAPLDWNFGSKFNKLWGDSPPDILITVRDAGGQRVLQERGPITPENGWIVTGSSRAKAVEVYKFAKFRATMFSSYTITLRVLRGSTSAGLAHPLFTITTIKSYALMPSVFFFLTLVAVVVVAALVIGIFQFGSYWDRRIEASGERTA